ncbi:hypothetical protein MKEN_00475300 [Mycena kentingensis (nom. inval.)]|nr:hypothetical protein MKEN_00475300 [Mycena kentingensis (nom. inval.)]
MELVFSPNSMVAATISSASESGTPLYTLTTSLSGDRSTIEDVRTGGPRVVGKITRKVLLADKVAFAVEGAENSKLREMKLEKWMQDVVEEVDGRSIRVGCTIHVEEGITFVLRAHDEYQLALYAEGDNTSPLAHWKPPVPPASAKTTSITLVLDARVEKYQMQVIIAFLLEERRRRAGEYEGLVGGARQPGNVRSAMFGTAGWAGS